MCSESHSHLVCDAVLDCELGGGGSAELMSAEPTPDSRALDHLLDRSVWVGYRYDHSFWNVPIASCAALSCTCI